MTELWQDISTGFGLALITYVGTNADNFLALVGLAANQSRPRPIVLGFSVATIFVLLLATSFVLLTYLIPTGSLRYLGIVPIAIGLRLLAIANTGSAASVPSQLTVASVCTVLVFNSFDTIAAFGPLLAESKSIVRVSLIAGYLIAASILIWAVFHVSRTASKLIGHRKAIHLIAPIIMIVVGCYILFNTGTDVELGQ
jgi:cadmium resistance protein CadD (predicted permease)